MGLLGSQIAALAALTQLELLEVSFMLTKLGIGLAVFLSRVFCRTCVCVVRAASGHSHI